MRLAIDSGTLLYGLGVLFAVAALLYCVRDVVFGLSITVKAALLLLCFVAFFVGGVALERDALDVVAFALSGVTYVVLAGYVVVRYSPGETGTFVLLAASAGLFVGLGYALRAGIQTPSRRTAGLALGGLLFVSVLLVGADTFSGGVTYDVRKNESVTVSMPAQEQGSGGYTPASRQIGTINASNPSPFRRALEPPSLSACLVGPTEAPRDGVWANADRGKNTIAGSTTYSYAVTADLPIDTNRTDPMTFAVERDIGCDAERSEPTIAVQIGESGGLD